MDLKVQITVSRKNISLVLVYGITEHPMMLATNKEIKSKDDVIKVAITKTANPLKENISFFYYWLAKGIFCILAYAKEGIQLWFRTKRPAYCQPCLELAV